MVQPTLMPPLQAYPQVSDDELARAFVPLHLVAELTSRCNLRCTYCQKSWDSWNAQPGRDEDIRQPILERLYQSLKDGRFKLVQLSGVGEFTFRKDWTGILGRFRDLGLGVTLISNFARPLAVEELDTLLKLEHLMVSLDTMDAETLKKVRRSASLAVIIANLVRLRMHANKTGVRMPTLALNAVLYYDNMLGIEDLAYFAVECGANIMNYSRMMPLLGTSPRELVDAEPARAREALRQAGVAREVLTRRGITPSFWGDLLQTLEARAAA